MIFPRTTTRGVRLTRLAAGGTAAALVLLMPRAVEAQNLPSSPLAMTLPMPGQTPALVPLVPEPREDSPFLKGRFLVGINVSRKLTPEDNLGSPWSLSPFIRNTPRRLGWGPSFGLNWYKGDIAAVVNGVQTTIGEVKVRPVMLGVGYTVGGNRVRTSISLVGGYAFSDATLTTTLPEGTAASIRIDDSWVVRPNVGVTIAVTKRLAIAGSIGYVYTNPTITISVTRPGGAADSASGSYRADYVSATIGTAVSIF